MESGGGVGMIGLPKAREIEKKIRMIPMKECVLAPGLCIESFYGIDVEKIPD